jgi:hypothetical protein
VILEWHDLIADDSQEPYWKRWKPESPVYLRFVPIIGWNYKNDRKYIYATPITPPVYQHTIDMLKNGSPYNTAKTATFGYCIRDGAIFDVDDMRDSDLWERLYDYAVAGHDIEIHGNIPDCYKNEISKIMKVLVEEQARQHAGEAVQQHGD